ncbi:MAG TPA: gamma-glutamylcyclotransferase family protein [Acidobacteriota bacterium]|nr:gamma-glutamylcyclotransferase family protein [Acidobacteriota bacterium]
MSEKTIAVFFYGLFMDESLLASKGIRPSSAAIGHLEGYGIRIGSRATLVREHGNRAHGVLMMLQAKDVEALYSDESVADYVSEPVSVVLSDGSPASAICYNLPEQKLEGKNVDYARSLLSLAGELGLPADYVEQIRAQAT